MNPGELPTYRAGILQSKAHRALKQLMFQLLKQHRLTMMQWSLLGLIYDAGQKGARVTQLAQDLDTTKAYVTGQVNVLEARNLVVKVVDQADSRARLVAISKSAVKSVERIENELRQQMRTVLYENISREELATYITVLGKLARLSSRTNRVMLD